jgi:hypothetical protein
LKKVLTAVCAAVTLFGANLHFSLHKMESGKGDTLLIIGGIHGNEPGGYFAPSLFLSRYKIEHGNVWVVPNLNFDSIVANQRGVYGDMNRKFAVIKISAKLFFVNRITFFGDQHFVVLAAKIPNQFVG